MHKLFLFCSFLFSISMAHSQETLWNVQPSTGPGGTEYISDSVRISKHAETDEGFWLFEPVTKGLDSAHVVIFIHGYGAINPMVYGGWIDHLVKKGNIVIFPRYQKSIFPPRTHTFVPNTVKGIHSALDTLNNGKHLTPILRHLSIVGHSYGGTIAANLSATFEEHGLPQPASTLLCSPGTGPFKGALLDDYSSIPADVKLLIMVSEDDDIVGDKLGKEIFDSASQVKHKYLIRQVADAHQNTSITAGHNECYSLNEKYDMGIHNITTKRAKRISCENAVDYYGYWKFLDALHDCSRSGTYCEYAIGNTVQQRFMGQWNEETNVKEFSIE